MKQPIDAIKNIPSEITPKEAISLSRFIHLALIADISFTFEFDTNRRVNGDHAFGPNGQMIPYEEIPEEHIIQGQQGFKIEVGGSSFNDEKGDEALYPSVGLAVHAALELLFRIISEDSGRNEAKEIFSQYYKITD